MFKYPKILYFVKGSLPTKDAVVEAEKYGPNVGFRNANLVKDGNPEQCDGVAGEVPALYKQFPSADKVVKAFAAERCKKPAVEKKPASKKVKAEPIEVEKEPIVEKEAVEWSPN